jgi:integrase
MQGTQARRAVHLFESNRLRPYSTRRIRQIIHAYALAAGIQKRVYPHLFRHQIITFLTKQGLISPKLGLQALAPVNLLLAGSHKKLCDGLKSVL